MPHLDATYRFGPYELRTRSREVYKNGKKLKLRGQPFQILRALVDRPGDVVTRQELQRLLWPVETFVDFEHGLNTAIKELRGALNDSASEPQYIETLPKLGYRILAPVESSLTIPQKNVEALEISAATESAGVASGSANGLRGVIGRRRWPIAVAAGVVILAGLAATVQWLRSRSRLPAPGARAMLAVLPFENLTGDASQDYFADGLTEEMITQLGHLDPQHLGVIARTSVMHYKHGQQSLQQIGRELGVQYVLEGSMRREGDKARISAQLIQLTDQTHLWSREYDRELGGLLAVQGEIAREAADEIQFTLGAPKRIEALAHDRSIAAPNPEAYDLYLRGLYFWNKRTVPGFQQAIDYFQRAIAKDSKYARAYAGLAYSYALIGVYSTAPQTEFMPRARAAALKALEIDDSQAEAHTALALIVQNYDWDWQTSEREYQRAIKLDPNYATAHQWYAEHLAWLGRFDEAFGESERARQLDPLSLIIATDHAEILYLSRQYDRAIEELRAVREIEPAFPRAGMIVSAFVEKGLYAEALEDIEKQRHAFGDGPWRWEALAYAYGRSGRQEQARNAVRELEQLSRHQPIDPASIAWAYLCAGERDKAFAWLQKAYIQHSNALHTLKVEPGFDSVRSDPRFQDLLRRVSLADTGDLH